MGEHKPREREVQTKPEQNTKDWWFQLLGRLRWEDFKTTSEIQFLFQNGKAKQPVTTSQPFLSQRHSNLTTKPNQTQQYPFPNHWLSLRQKGFHTKRFKLNAGLKAGCSGTYLSFQLFTRLQWEDYLTPEYRLGNMGRFTLRKTNQPTEEKFEINSKSTQ